MFSRRTLGTFGVIVLLYGLLTVPGFFFPRYLDSPPGLLVAFPYLSIYLFHRLGIPGLLEHNGACGWGWCAPTPAGWAFLVTFWVLAAWLVAWGVSHVGRRGADVTRDPPE